MACATRCAHVALYWRWRLSMAVDVEVPRRLFTVEEYHRMAEAGILAEDERVELIDGEIVEMAPIGTRHIGCVINATRLFITRLGDRAVISPQNPVVILPRSEPQPDVVLLRQGPSPIATSVRPQRTCCSPLRWPIRRSASTASSKRVSTRERASRSSGSASWRTASSRCIAGRASTGTPA